MLPKGNVDEYAKVPIHERVSYTLGAMSLSIFYFLTLSLCIFFFTDVMHMSATTVGTLVIVSRLFDGISDLIAGNIIDRTKSKFGKASAWVLRFCGPYAAFMLAMYAMPDGLSAAGKAAYMFVTYNLTVTVGFTMVNTAFGVLNSMMTRDAKEREISWGLYMFQSPVASAIGVATALPMIQKLGGDHRAWIITMAIYGVIGVVLLIQAALICKERVKQDIPDTQDKDTQMKMIKAVITNGQWWVNVILTCMYSVFLVGFSTLMTYFSQYIMGDLQFTSTINNFQSYLMAAVSLLMIPLMHRFKKSTLVLLGMVIVVPGQIIMGIDVLNKTTLIIGTLIRGFGFGFLGTAMYAMVSDIIEYGHWKKGIRTDAMITTSSAFGNKLGVMIAGGVFPILLGNAGYDGALDVQPDSAISMIKFLFVWSPVIVAIIVFIVTKFFYKVDDVWDTVVSDLKEGKFAPDAPYAPNR